MSILCRKVQHFQDKSHFLGAETERLLRLKCHSNFYHKLKSSLLKAPASSGVSAPSDRSTTAPLPVKLQNHQDILVRESFGNVSCVAACANISIPTVSSFSVFSGPISSHRVKIPSSPSTTSSDAVQEKPALEKVTAIVSDKTVSTKKILPTPPPIRSQKFVHYRAPVVNAPKDAMHPAYGASDLKHVPMKRKRMEADQSRVETSPESIGPTSRPSRKSAKLDDLIDLTGEDPLDGIGASSALQRYSISPSDERVGSSRRQHVYPATSEKQEARHSTAATDAYMARLSSKGQGARHPKGKSKPEFAFPNFGQELSSAKPSARRSSRPIRSDGGSASLHDKSAVQKAQAIIEAWKSSSYEVLPDEPEPFSTEPQALPLLSRRTLSRSTDSILQSGSETPASSDAKGRQSRTLNRLRIRSPTGPTKRDLRSDEKSVSFLSSSLQSKDGDLSPKTHRHKTLAEDSGRVPKVDATSRTTTKEESIVLSTVDEKKKHTKSPMSPRREEKRVLKPSADDAPNGPESSRALRSGKELAYSAKEAGSVSNSASPERGILKHPSKRPAAQKPSSPEPAHAVTAPIELQLRRRRDDPPAKKGVGGRTDTSRSQERESRMQTSTDDSDDLSRSYEMRSRKTMDTPIRTEELSRARNSLLSESTVAKSDKSRRVSFDPKSSKAVGSPPNSLIKKFRDDKDGESKRARLLRSSSQSSVESDSDSPMMKQTVVRPRKDNDSSAERGKAVIKQTDGKSQKEVDLVEDHQSPAMSRPIVRPRKDHDSSTERRKTVMKQPDVEDKQSLAMNRPVVRPRKDNDSSTERGKTVMKQPDGKSRKDIDVVEDHQSPAMNRPVVRPRKDSSTERGKTATKRPENQPGKSRKDIDLVEDTQSLVMTRTAGKLRKEVAPVESGAVSAKQPVEKTRKEVHPVIEAETTKVKRRAASPRKHEHPVAEREAAFVKNSVGRSRKAGHDNESESSTTKLPVGRSRKEMDSVAEKETSMTSRFAGRSRKERGEPDSADSKSPRGRQRPQSGEDTRRLLRKRADASMSEDESPDAGVSRKLSLRHRGH